MQNIVKLKLKKLKLSALLFYLLETIFCDFPGFFLGLFNISQTQGTIFVNRSLEQEAASIFHLVIGALDSPEGGKTRKRRGDLWDIISFLLSCMMSMCVCVTVPVLAREWVCWLHAPFPSFGHETCLQGIIIVVSSIGPRLLNISTLIS